MLAKKREQVLLTSGVVKKTQSKIGNGNPTVCPPVAELPPRKFGPLFFGRHSGPNRSDF